MAGDVVSDSGAESEPALTPSVRPGSAAVITTPTSALSPHGPDMRQLGWSESVPGVSSTELVALGDAP